MGMVFKGPFNDARCRLCGLLKRPLAECLLVVDLLLSARGADQQAEENMEDKYISNGYWVGW